ncbi:hypothetical protein KGF54_003120 [Candida jiufengensis]|uniref:uncharacterized protein n=1 Tax=Candida jiufengensis TaxID=497108 RepID=UPI002225062A|nr:uncharacterized protein KGF54_003120 [Candida jiufengensis]KAI5952254.1 hypothetical protein KGF54_003120 [Candida jiufengensis]
MLFDLTLLTLALTTFASANPISKRAPKHLSYPLHKVEYNETHEIAKRSGHSSLPLDNYYDFGYYANISIGSNKAPLHVQVDTGSYQLWIPESKTGDSLNKFDPFISKTYKNESKPYEITYVGQDSVKGYYGTDDLWLPDGTKVPNYEFATVYQYSRSTPFWGIAGSTVKNISVANAMRNAGLIDHAAYSIELGALHAQKASLVFGAIDRAKYNGNLTILPKGDGTGVLTNSVTFANGKKFNIGINLPIDTGAPFTYLSKPIADPILTELSGGKLNSDYTFDCSIANQNKNLTFNFNGVNIDIPYSDLIRQSGSKCVSTILVDTFQVLGDNFLRHAYVAWNFDTNKVGLAQATHSDKTDLIDFYF